MKIAIVQKCISNINYSKQYGVDNPDIYNLSSVKVSKLLKKDVDLDISKTGFQPEKYDYVILVGSEALKMFTKATAVTDYTGKIAPSKPEYEDCNFIASISPAMLAFKPENKPVFEATVNSIQTILEGNQVVAADGDYQFFTEPSEIREHLAMILDNPEFKVVGLDTETSALAVRHGYVLGISLSYKVNQGVYMDANAMDMYCVKLLQKIIDTRETVLHNAKFDMHFLTYHFNIMFMGRKIHDTMVMHYLLDERQGTHGLKSLTMKYGTLGDYDRDLDEFKKYYCKAHGIKQEDFSYELIPWGIIKIYAAKDTDATLCLFEKFYPVLKKNLKLYNCYHDLMMPALHFLTNMEARGIPISVPRLNIAKTLLSGEIEALKAQLYEVPEVVKMEAEQGKIFNPNSTPQLRKLLFDYVGLAPTGKLTATGAISTDADVLAELAEQHSIPQLILDIRQKSKLKNTYIDKLLLVIDQDNKVRTGFNLTSTTSGRLSSSGNFNMQQLPRDNPIIKGCIKAPEGYKIVAVDLQTSEVYFAAVLSGDKNLQQVFINMQKDPEKYADFHSSIASMVFGMSCEPRDVKKLYPALRQAAKAITFGIMFGSGAAKVAESVNEALLKENLEPTCTKEQAQEYIATYYGKFPRLKAWIKECHNTIKANGFIYNFFGRKRRLHNINSADRAVAGKELRSGFNAVIQSASSDHLTLGAQEADLEIAEKGIDANIFAVVHDSIVACVKEDQVEQYLEIVYRNVKTDRGCSIPGTPIGIDAETEDGGSRDYSGGKLDEMFPEMAAA